MPFCSECGTKAEGGAKFCGSCGSAIQAPAAASAAPAPAASASRNPFKKAGGSAPKFGGASEKCPRCTKAVYHAERGCSIGGSVFHKRCSRCKECGKGLDSLTLKDHGGEIYCGSCHQRLYGPKGFRGGTAGGQMHVE